MASKKDTLPGLLHFSFNHDTSHFSVGTEKGYFVFTVCPFEKQVHQQEGAVGIAEMLYSTNILALVGGGKNPKYSVNRVVVYDDSAKAVVYEIEMKNEIKAVRLRKDKLVIVCKNKVTVYSLSAQPNKLFTYESGDNEKGLVALSTLATSSNAVLAFPGRTDGQLNVVEIGSTNKTSPPVQIIPAHTSSLSAIAVSPSGALIATASEKGTLVRVFESKTGKLTCELRRGVDAAEIYSLAFNQNETKLCVASDKGTVHVFKLASGTNSDDPNSTTVQQTSSNAQSKTNSRQTSQGQMAAPGSGSNRQSSLSFLSNYLPKYFSSEWSFAYFKLPVETRCIAAFTYEKRKELPLPSSDATPESVEAKEAVKEKIVVIGADGSFYLYSYDENGGECHMDAFHWYMKDEL